MNWISKVWVAVEAWFLTSHRARIVDLHRDRSEGSVLVDELATGPLISWHCSGTWLIETAAARKVAARLAGD